MKVYPFYIRLFILAAILPSLALLVFPRQPWHNLLLAADVALLAWGLVLMYLRKTGRTNWDGPAWGKSLQESPRSRRLAAVAPGICAAFIPILFLFNRRWGLNNDQLGFACGVLLGISLLCVVKLLRSKSSRTGLEAVPTQPGGTN